AEAEPASAPASTGSPRSTTPWVLVAVSALAALFVSWLHFRERPAQERSIPFTIPTSARLPSQVRISPDGTKLAFVGQNPDGKPIIWVRSLDKLQPQALPGTEGAYFPIWSPDSRQIAFYDLYDHIKKIDASGGQTQVIC